ncbi:MAG: peptide-methionine (S)-S-oxide reductase MsrA [Pirellulales bacterium]|nr:peptide-methionine (S)-S-oxide reductase MsrA [Pirellulales bacterium]
MIETRFSVANPLQNKGTSVDEKAKGDERTALATFGGGCFWCTEAVFEQFDGVEKVVSGFAGGFLPDPTYKDICSGLTGHAEVVQVTYDPTKVSYPRLLEAFWQSHDPTTLNRQGNDVGPQYRSIILYHDQEQKKIAEDSIRKLDKAKIFRSPIVTEVAPLTTFYLAEQKHQNFYQANKGMRYCQAVIEPKLKKIRKLFAEEIQPR